MFFPPREIVDAIKKTYFEGDRVELIFMNDTYRNMQPGLHGTVTGVDDTGTIHVYWDNGCSLGVIYGEDACKKLDSVKVICYGEEEIWDSRKELQSSTLVPLPAQKEVNVNDTLRFIWNCYLEKQYVQMNKYK